MPTIEPLIDADRLAARVAELGREIRAEVGDVPLTAVCVLRGSVLFFADLVRALDGDVLFEFLGTSSYEGTESTGRVRITHDLLSDIAGRHVIVVEDIVDTGLTLEYLLQVLHQRKPASLRVAALLDKPSRRQVEVPVDWIGFQIPDHFVVGYGLDLDQRYRNVPFVGIYRD